MNNLRFKMNDLGADSVMKFKDCTINDVLSFFHNIFGFFINWLDDVFPPGTRMETLKKCIFVAAPYAIICLILLLCLPCLYFCLIYSFRLVMGIFSCFFHILKGVWRYFRKMLCCCCTGGKKMMKAPGRNLRIPRAPFQANPSGYFRGLRANQPILLS